MGITWAGVLIGGLAILAIGIWIAAEWRGWFKRIPPSQTSEQIEDYPASEDFRMLCEQRARERGL